MTPEGIDDRSIVYDCGVGEDMSFARSLVTKYGLRVWAFDPTPKSIAWYKRQLPTAGITFLPWGIAGFDGATPFVLPDDPTHVSGTIVGVERPDATTIQVEVRRLVTIMADLGHARVSLLKLDIEGAEYAVLADLLRSGVQVDQVLVEFHGPGRSSDWRPAQAAIEQLNRHGYQLFAARHGTELSFVRTTECYSVTNEVRNPA
jgi:FkbM family methyltransferase